MTNFGGRCRLCKRKIKHRKESIYPGLCFLCDVAVFIVHLVSSAYRDNSVSDSIRSFMIELGGWALRDYPHVRPYINVARQILVRLIKNPAEKIQWNTIRKGHSPISMNRIRTVLADAGIVNGTLQNNVVSPGPLTAKLRIHRFQSRSIHDSQVKECTREALGVLTISIVRRYLKDIEEDRGSQKVPQSILAPLRIIAYNIMTSGLDKNRPINEKMTEYSLTSACVRLTRRQKEKIQEGMIGAIEGSPHIISEVDRTGAVSFKAEVINFMRLVRERYRERLRSRERIRI